MKLSVTIITKNEEKNVARAIRSVFFADEVIILDSESTDRTKEISRQLGARVFDQPFLGYGQQKNLAATYAQYPWILNIDADEEVSSELALEIQQWQKQDEQSYDSKVDCYEMPRLNHYCGKAIYFGGWYPDRKKRLYRKNTVEWSTPSVHEDLISIGQDEDGKIKNVQSLQGHILHYPFVTIKEQVEKNLRYALLGADHLLNKKQRRPTMLEVIWRPLGKFIECYILKQGFRDGYYGWVIAINAAYSLFLKYVFAYTRDR
jgi:glycosyltransferase involved in cell wall biosynthesis